MSPRQQDVRQRIDRTLGYGNRSLRVTVAIVWQPIGGEMNTVHCERRLGTHVAAQRHRAYRFHDALFGVSLFLCGVGIGAWFF